MSNRKLLGYSTFVTVLLSFIWLAKEVKSVLYFPLDLQISKVIQSINFDGFSEIMTFISSLGWSVPMYITIGLVAIVLFILNKRIASIFIFIISFVDMALFQTFSKIISRPRPNESLIHVDFHISAGGFPSGHVLLYTLIFGFLIYLSYVSIKSIWIKTTIISIFLLFVFLVGVARIYSGQHWPSDVLGAYLLSIITIIPIIKLYKYVKGLELFSSQG